MRPHAPAHLRHAVPLAALGLAALLLAACSGGGSGGGTTGGGSADAFACTHGDFFDWGGATYTETTSATPPVCDPQARGAFFPDILGAGAPGTNLTLHWDWLPASASFDNFLSVNLYGPVPASLPAVYPLGISTAAGTAQAAAQTTIVTATTGTCTLDSGSFTVTAYGAVGGKIEGTYTVTATSGTACPGASFGGNFSVTREPDL